MKKIASFGIMEVWERSVIDYRLPYYVSRTTDDKILEEFHYKDAAIQWAKENKDG